jgi:hypothetical protein
MMIYDLIRDKGDAIFEYLASFISRLEPSAYRPVPSGDHVRKDGISIDKSTGRVAGRTCTTSYQLVESTPGRKNQGCHLLKFLLFRLKAKTLWIPSRSRRW